MRYVTRDGQPAVEVRCDTDYCDDVVYEPRWMSPAGWRWPKVEGRRLDLCPACVQRNSAEPNVPHKSRARRRERRAA